MATKTFNPNRLTFDEGLERIRKALDNSGVRVDGRIVTSRDKDAGDLRDALAVENVPKGFTKYQLPVYLDAPSQLFVTIAEPNVRAGRHVHEDGDGIRFIAGGSITFEGQELSAGDWMFVPKGRDYEFEVGPNGALMCYCYCCCC